MLLHVVFYAKLGEEAGAFDYADVVNALCDKLVYRHPHIYGRCMPILRKRSKPTGRH